MPAALELLDKHRSSVRTGSGLASYIDTGGPGRTALIVHGIGSSSYLWRHVIGQLDGERRCLAIDLPLHGQTPAAGQDLSLPGLARFLADCCDALQLTDIDLDSERHWRRGQPGIRRRPPRAAAHPDPDQLRDAGQLPAQGPAARDLARPAGLARPARTPARAGHPPRPHAHARRRLPGPGQAAR